MKRILALALTFCSVGLAASSAEAKAGVPSNAVVSRAAASPTTIQWRRNNRWGRNRVRVTTQTRLVRAGRRVYRETYQVRYLPNGSAQTRLISRERVR
jgi:hypothetical protein